MKPPEEDKGEKKKKQQSEEMHHFLIPVSLLCGPDLWKDSFPAAFMLFQTEMVKNGQKNVFSVYWRIWALDSLAATN